MTAASLCSLCEGRGVLLAYTPDGLPTCPRCQGAGRITRPSLTAAQILTLTAASVTPGGVELTAKTAQGIARRVSFPRPVLAQVLTVEQLGAAPVHCLTLHTAPPLARRLLAGVHVEPHTPEGAAALAVLGVTP